MIISNKLNNEEVGTKQKLHKAYPLFEQLWYLRNKSAIVKKCFEIIRVWYFMGLMPQWDKTIACK